MLIERIWSANRYRNFHYLIACPESGEALAIDPLEWQLCLDAARAKGWQITQILNTHEHLDHTGGNAGLVDATGAKVLAHAAAASRIGGVDRGLGKGDVDARRAHRGARVSRHPGTYDGAHLSARRGPSNRRSSAVTRCSMPARATATTAAIRSSSTRPS